MISRGFPARVVNRRLHATERMAYAGEGRLSLSAEQFFEDDFNASLFPMKTNLLVVTRSGDNLKRYIEERVLSADPAHSGDCFLPQQKVYAAKPQNHLRRTVCLDPVASYYLYDLTYRFRNSFRKPVSEERKAFGYRFQDRKPIPVHAAFEEFRKEVNIYDFVFAHVLRFDVASYFNSLYHHDVCHWFAALPGVDETVAKGFGQFCREIGGGRSIDFLPQGVYPAKMIGSEFLKFVDLSKEVRSARLLRFMDDIYLFDNDEDVITRDFIRIQQLLGGKSLNVNPSKTARVTGEVSISDSVSEIRGELNELIEGADEIAVFGSGVEARVERAQRHLGEAEMQRLLDLLVDVRAEESDVELILAVLQHHSEGIASRLAMLLQRFPNIVKQLHKICHAVDDKGTVAQEMLNLVRSDAELIEYQLLWMAAIAEDHLATTPVFEDLIVRIYQRASGMPMAQAKVLEIPNQTGGLKEIRDGHLKGGASSWLTWASAAGTRTLLKAERNYVLDYFSKESPMNYLVAECMKQL